MYKDIRKGTLMMIRDRGNTLTQMFKFRKICNSHHGESMASVLK